MKTIPPSLTIGLATFAGVCHGMISRYDTDFWASIPVETWKPVLGAPWQIVLSNTLNLSETVVPSTIQIFDIDLFDNTNDGIDDSAINTLHGLGKKVICYFSAGTFEPERPDASRFEAADMGKELPDWPGEKWLNLNSKNVRSIMDDRIALAARMGCDAIDPDNVDAYDNDNGLGLKEADSISFVEYLAAEAYQYNMAIGLKNAGAIIDDVQDVVHFAVNEQCVDQKECKVYTKFLASLKPVFHIEYPAGAGKSVSEKDRKLNCEGSDVGIPNFSTVLKTEDLDGWTEYCDGTVVTTAVER